MNYTPGGRKVIAINLAGALLAIPANSQFTEREVSIWQQWLTYLTSV